MELDPKRECRPPARLSFATGGSGRWKHKVRIQGTTLLWQGFLIMALHGTVGHTMEYFPANAVHNALVCGNFHFRGL